MGGMISMRKLQRTDPALALDAGGRSVVCDFEEVATSRGCAGFAPRGGGGC